MNRREAIAALLALPAATRITRAAIASTDVIVIEAESKLSDDEGRGIEAAMKRVWPHNEIVVLDGGLKLKIAETKP